MSKDKMTQTSVQHKRTSVSGNTPLPDQLEVGELALNLADKTIFTKDGSGIITQLGNNDPEWAIVGKEEEEQVGWSNWSQSVFLGYTNISNPAYTEEAVGIGFNATAGSYGVGVGWDASGGMFGVSVGRQSRSTDNATAIGNEAKATKTLSIALGNRAETTKAYEFAISPNITEVNFSGTTVIAEGVIADSASINKLTVGPDSADDAKLYFETGAGTHVLEGREEGAVDMNSWVSYDNAPQAGWRGLAYGDGKWIAVGERDPDRMMSSTDGINWTAIPVGPDYNYRDILYDGSKWVALAWSRPDGGNERIQTSTDGVTWSGDAVISTTPSSGNWSSIAYDGTRYVAVGGYYGGNPAPGLIGYSTDAVNWTLATYTGNWLQSVVYADGQFVAVGISGACATSSDGVTWTQRTAPSNSWTSVAYGNDVWVAVSSSGTTRAMTSSDGVTWTLAPQYSVFEYDWQSITYGDGKFVAVSNNGSQRVMWSTNGTSWIAQTITSKVWYSVDYAAGKFVGVGNTTQVLILEHDTGKAGLFYDGELVATTENLRPVFEKLTDFVEDFNELGYDSALVQLQIDSAIANYNWNTAGGDFHDSALTGDQIDSALIRENYIATVNGVGPTPGSSDIGIHGGNTQTDAGSGVWIADDLAAKVRRITDTNTGTNYNPSNGIISLPLATTSSVQTQIDTSIDALKFQDSADVATVVDPKLPFGGSSQMTILHASWDASAGTTTPTILSSYGISGITRIDAGEYRVDFMTNMVNANYTVTTGCGTDDYSGTGSSPRTVSILSRANSSVTVLCERTDDAVNEDNEYMSVMIIGNQVSS